MFRKRFKILTLIYSVIMIIPVSPVWAEDNSVSAVHGIEEKESGIGGFLKKVMRPMELADYFPGIGAGLKITPLININRNEPLTVTRKGYLEDYMINRSYYGIGFGYSFYIRQPTPLVDLSIETEKLLASGYMLDNDISSWKMFDKNTSNTNIYFSRRFTPGAGDKKEGLFLEPLVGLSVNKEVITSSMTYMNPDNQSSNSEEETWRVSGLRVGLKAGLGGVKTNIYYCAQGGTNNYLFRGIPGELTMRRLGILVDFAPDFLVKQSRFMKDTRIRVFGEITKRILSGTGYDREGVYGYNSNTYNYLECGVGLEKPLNKYISVNAAISGIRNLSGSPGYTGGREFTREGFQLPGIGIEALIDFARVDYNRVREFLRGSKKKIFEEKKGIFNRREDFPVKRKLARNKAKSKLDLMGEAGRGIVGVVLFVNGELEVQKRGTYEWRRVMPGQDLYEEDEVITSKGTTAAIMLTDGSTIKMNEKTSLKLEMLYEENYLKTCLKLDIGEIYSEVIPGGGLKPRLKIRTPVSSIDADKALFNVRVDLSGRTILSVRDGNVKIRSKNGEIAAQANTGAYVSPGDAPETFREIDWSRIDRWLEKVELYDDARIEIEEFSKLLSYEKTDRKAKDIMKEKNIAYEEKIPSFETAEKKHEEIRVERKKLHKETREVENKFTELKKKKSSIAKSINNWERDNEAFLKDTGGFFAGNLSQLAKIAEEIRDELLLFELEFDITNPAESHPDNEVIRIRKMKKFAQDMEKWKSEFKHELKGIDKTLLKNTEELFMGVVRIKEELFLMMEVFNNAMQEALRISGEMKETEMKSVTMELAMEKAKSGEKQITITVTEEIIRFETNRAEIKEEYYGLLDKFADVFLILTNYRVVIGGYTDNIGSGEYNMKLSAKRAENMVNYFVENYDLPEDMFVSIGYGEENPVDTNETKKGRANNRRVEVTLMKK